MVRRLALLTETFCLTLVRSRTLCLMLSYRTNAPSLPVINQTTTFIRSKVSKIKQSIFFVREKIKYLFTFGSFSSR